MEQDIQTLPTEQEAEQRVEPTTSVKNFWERLDEVFVQNTELRQRMEELVEQFPTEQRINQEYKSFLFQPERIAISSNDDISVNLSSAGPIGVAPFSDTQGHIPGEKFSSFRIRFKRPLRNVKSIQLLSATIPNAAQNIPDNQVFFFYYKIRSVGMSYQGEWTIGNTYNTGDLITYLGGYYVLNATDVAASPSPPPINPKYQIFVPPADLTRPNYYDLNPNNIQYVYLTPTYFWPPEFVVAGDELYFNRTFEDYNDLLASLNYCTTQAFGNNSIANDVSFQYDAILNKIIMVPSGAGVVAGYYYMPCGYEDPNITAFMQSTKSVSFLGLGVTTANRFQFDPGYTLNLRLGFTWNGIFTNPFNLTDPWSDNTFIGSLYYYMRKKDPGFYPFIPGPPFPIPPSIPDWASNTITFNSYPDLVNTSCVRIYADVALGSAQDSLGSGGYSNNLASQEGLLSIVPVNTANLGVGFYQNNFDNPLTKIPKNLTEIGISMLTDQGTPFYLPNSAVVLLELGITYN